MTINGKTTLLGLLGWPVSHSLSPTMHNAAAQALNLNVAYLPLPVHPQNLAPALAGLPALGFRGVNVTIPHKQTIIPYLDSLTPAAQALQAVNTITIDDNGRCHGDNTDWQGFLNGLPPLAAPPGPALIFGAGGSARAIVYALANNGHPIHLVARRRQQAQQLLDDLRPHLPPTSQLQAYPLAALATIPFLSQTATSTKANQHLIVNTTPLGMTPNTNQSIWPEDRPWPAHTLVIDLVYNPPLTRFLKQAQSAGLTTLNGLPMLLHQGALAFTQWTAHPAPIDIMAAALTAAQI